MSISNFRKLIILSSIAFLLHQPSYAQGDANPEDMNAYLKKKEAALGNSYGANTFALNLSDEDKEIGQAIRKMTRQNKTQAQISKRIEQIKEKYRLKSVAESLRRAKLGQSKAEKDYRTQLNLDLAQSKTGSDLHNFILHSLLRQLSLLPRDYEKLDRIEEAVARTYTHIAPKYEALMASNDLLKTIISDYKQGEYTRSFTSEKEVLSQRKKLLSEIKEEEKAISIQTAFDLIYKNEHTEIKLDRKSLLEESAYLAKEIVLSRKACLKNLKSNYEVGYNALKKQVEEEISSPNLSPLRKKLLRNRFDLLPTQGISTEKFSEFYNELSQHLASADNCYIRLEAQIAELNLLRKDAKSKEIDWDHLEISDAALTAQIERLIIALEDAKFAKTGLFVPIQVFSKGYKYHGNYKATQKEGLTLLESYSRSKRNKTFAQVVKATGKGLLSTGKYAGIGIGGVVLSPFALVGGAAYGVGKYILLPSYRAASEGVQGAVQDFKETSRENTKQTKLRKQQHAALAAAFKVLKRELELELNTPNTTPLRRYVVQHLYEHMIHSVRSTEEIRNFYKLADQYEGDIGNEYLRLESLVSKFLLGAGTDYNHIDWNQISFTEIEGTISELLTSLNSVRIYRKSRVRGNEYGRHWISERYHGDYKQTEKVCRLILDKYESYQRGVSLGRMKGSLGSFFSAPFLGVQKILQSSKLHQKMLTKLELEVKTTISDPTTTPLRKSVLKHVFEQLKRSSQDLDEIENFGRKSTWYENKSATNYADLEALMGRLISDSQRTNGVIDWAQVNFSKVDSNTINNLHILLAEARKYRKVKTDPFSDFSLSLRTNYHGDYKKTERLIKEFLDQHDNYQIRETLSKLKSSAADLAKKTGKIIVAPYSGAKALVKYTQVGIHRFNIHQELNREKKTLMYRLGTKQGPNESKKAAFKVSKNLKKWRYLADDDVNKLSEEAYDKYIAKLIKDDLAGIKNLETIQKEASYLSDLFVRKSAELRIKLRELIDIKAELKSVKKNSSNLEVLSNSKYESLVRYKLEIVFEDPERYYFSPLEFDTMAKAVRDLIQNETARNLAWEKLREAKAELATLGPSYALSESDRIYKRELFRGIRHTKSILKSHTVVTEHDFQIIENARRAANAEYQELETKRRGTESQQKESFWRDELKRRYRAGEKHATIDGKIHKLLAKGPEGFESQLENFVHNYAVQDGRPSVPYSTLRKATDDLDQGKWKQGNAYEVTEEQLKLDSEIEAQAAYCDFIESQDLFPAIFNSDVKKGADLKKGESPEDTSVEVSNAKSKETFIKNYVCLPPSPDLDTFDKMDQCLICFEPVNYDYKALSDFCDVAPEYDQLIQVPGDSEAHRLTSCGHLIHKACLEGLQINRGLTIYKCPKCPKQIPYHELDAYQRFQKHGFCLDSL